MKSFLRMTLCTLLTGLCCSLTVAQSINKSDKEADADKQVTQKYVIKTKPEPVYPREAKRKKAIVRLKALLSATGEVTDIELVKVMPEKLSAKIAKAFADKSIEAARKIEFTPAMKDGHPVSVYIVIEYHFAVY